MSDNILTGIKFCNYLALVVKNNYRYSSVRAYLNGYSTVGKNGEYPSGFTDNGFLQRAFTSNTRQLIQNWAVNNSKDTTKPEAYQVLLGGYQNNDACSNTTDRIFLLSMNDVTNPNYGFQKYDVSDTARIRSVTDYALANGIWYSEGRGGCWWTRSPAGDGGKSVRYIASTDERHFDGGDFSDNYKDADTYYYGVVPAMWVELP